MFLLFVNIFKLPKLGRKELPLKTLATYLDKKAITKQLASHPNRNLLELWSKTPSLWVNEGEDIATITKIFTDDPIAEKLLENIISFGSTVFIAKGTQPIETYLENNNAQLISVKESSFSVVLIKVMLHVVDMYFFEI